MTLSLTYKFAMASARDGANRQMRLAGRKAWNAEDYNLASQIFESICPEEKPSSLPIAHFKYLGRKWTKVTCAGRFNEFTGDCDRCDAVLINGRQNDKERI